MGTEKVEIVKARTDKRDYKSIILPNSLQLLLIIDPDTDKCAASMNVGVGSFSDPSGLEGLAHFLEHMLFYKSEKYPVEDSYSKYITEHGGSTNAFTASEQTNYYFDVNKDGFEEALDRFAQFFTKPLMPPDATMREIKAVDSENQKNLLSDGWRMHQLQKHISAEDHPFHKFSTGNWDTLEVKPKAKGLDTREELLKFYKENYSANLMRLVVYTNESLDKIRNLVEEKFQDIRNTNRSSFHHPGQPCTSEHLQILVRTVPIKQGHKLRIVWPVTPEIHHYMEGPCRYLGHLIGHEGEGSLYSVLKTFGWATGLSAGESDWNLDFSFFKVTIDLTDAGHEHMQDIIGLLFKYIELLQKSGVCKWIFEELSAVCETKFHYQDKVPPISYVVNIASNMQQYPQKDWLTGSSLPSKFSPSVIQTVLDQLSPNNVRIFWESRNFEGHTDQVEPWYGTAYSIEKVTDSVIQGWVLSAPDENLHLPAPNIFIPTDLSLKTVQEKVKFPVLLSRSSYSALWYKPDTLFSIPKAYVKIDFHCPYAGNSPETEVLTHIFTELLMDYLNEYAYYAQVAGLYYHIDHSDGFQVTLLGYNHKLRILLETIVEKIATFRVKTDRFSVIKETVTKEYQNLKYQQPYQQAMHYCSLILQDQTRPWVEHLEVLPLLQAEDLAKFVPVLLSRTFFECYVAGNIESHEAESMVRHIEDVLFKSPKPLCQPLFSSQHLTNRVVKLESGINYFYPSEGLNSDDENSALVHYIQVGRDDFKLNVKLQLFALVAKQPAFHQLRSVEQLGYITALVQRNDCGIGGLQFIIQSTVKGPGDIGQRVEAFLKVFETKLREMTNDEFKSNVNALIDMKLEKHKNLREESSFFWREIDNGTLRFDRKDFEVEALRQLSHQELIDFFDEYVKVGAPQKRTLSVGVYGKLHSSEYKAEASQPHLTEIDNIFSFRRSQSLYPSFKGLSGHVKL
ncbi:PREDICTED: insulin-degrading enzyme-like 1, peroxisomal [Lupinus angustifolius]|uniref:insulin-degrading enzyme-like 1, peroxisomal n=1 Tax=Lupinus angustifolius TaxID=3871 RepID=UPI00092FC10A|nr:PREDICTED: insulin-degrading enzyme-like 1, peroxisomal [Lupinus angustifolius]XP_019456156.1 PREDICTED: insulin-degrading enzyme-like 1, peroxisomal [Lupinus angustifolius]